MERSIREEIGRTDVDRLDIYNNARQKYRRRGIVIKGYRKEWPDEIKKRIDFMAVKSGAPVIVTIGVTRGTQHQERYFMAGGMQVEISRTIPSALRTTWQQDQAGMTITTDKSCKTGVGSLIETEGNHLSVLNITRLKDQTVLSELGKLEKIVGPHTILLISRGPRALLVSRLSNTRWSIVEDSNRVRLGIWVFIVLSKGQELQWKSEDLDNVENHRVIHLDVREIDIRHRMYPRPYVSNMRKNYMLFQTGKINWNAFIKSAAQVKGRGGQMDPEWEEKGNQGYRETVWHGEEEIEAIDLETERDIEMIQHGSKQGWRLINSFATTLAKRDPGIVTRIRTGEDTIEFGQQATKACLIDYIGKQNGRLTEKERREIERHREQIRFPLLTEFKRLQLQDHLQRYFKENKSRRTAAAWDCLEFNMVKGSCESHEKRMETCQDCVSRTREMMRMTYPEFWHQKTGDIVTQGRFIPLTKDPMKVYSYRPIVVSSIVIRAFSSFLLGRLRPAITGLASYQEGFRPGVTTRHPVRVRQWVRERSTIIKLDVESAFDSIPFSLLDQIERRYLDPEEVQIARYLRLKQSICLELNGRKWYQNHGVPQGYPSSPAFFILALDTAKIHQANLWRVVAFADDLTIASDRENATRTIQHFKKVLGDIGLRVNEGKTEKIQPNSRIPFRILGVWTRFPDGDIDSSCIRLVIIARRLRISMDEEDRFFNTTTRYFLWKTEVYSRFNYLVNTGAVEQDHGDILYTMKKSFEICMGLKDICMEVFMNWAIPNDSLAIRYATREDDRKVRGQDHDRWRILAEITGQDCRRCTHAEGDERKLHWRHQARHWKRSLYEFSSPILKALQIKDRKQPSHRNYKDGYLQRRRYLDDVQTYGWRQGKSHEELTNNSNYNNLKINSNLDEDTAGYTDNIQATRKKEK